MLQNTTLKFLRDLKKNNHRTWFEEHRPQYESAKKDFEIFIEGVIQKLGKKDPFIKELKAKDCLFRINRDVRFSKDKSPYKTNFGASISRGGKKSNYAGYYFHLEPGGSFAGGGIWMPMPPDLKKIRQEIDYNYEDFKKIIKAKKFQAVYGDLNKGEEYSLVKVPQGFEKDNPAADYLKLKCFVALKKITDSELTAKTLESDILLAFEALQPLIVFINQALETDPA